MALQRLEITHLERALMRGGEDDERRAARVERLPPARGAQAPSIAGLEAWEAVFGQRRGQVVAAALREGEELGGHDGADRVRTCVFGARVAAPVAEKAGHG